MLLSHSNACLVESALGFTEIPDGLSINVFLIKSLIFCSFLQCCYLILILQDKTWHGKSLGKACDF